MDCNKTPPSKLDLDNLRVIKLLGKGATGTVFLVHHKSNHDQPFALKVVEKSSAMHHHVDRRARHEVSVLGRLSAASIHYPFLPHLIGSFENQDFIGWAIPFCSGGDLNMLRYCQNDHVFSTSVIRFYVAEIICALECLHDLGIVYRDLKPENVLVQQNGHVKLTDFDLSRDLVPRKSDNPIGVRKDAYANFIIYSHTKASTTFDCELTLTRASAKGQPLPKLWPTINYKKGLKKAKMARVSPVSKRNTNDFSTNERSNSFVGTEEYVAPEIIRGDGHEFSVDWWALGVLCYEMLYGTTPFKGKNRKETYRNILLEEPEFIGKPNSLTDLIGKLLEKDPTHRLGYWRGACEIKEHEFFSGLKWDMLTEILRPPFLPLREETEVTEGGIDVREYFEKLKVPPSPLWSPSIDEHWNNVSLTEF